MPHSLDSEREVLQWSHSDVEWRYRFPVEEKLLRRIVMWFRAGLVFKAHRLLYDSALSSGVTKEKKKTASGQRGNTLKCFVLKWLKPKPESGLGCLSCVPHLLDSERKVPQWSRSVVEWRCSDLVEELNSDQVEELNSGQVDELLGRLQCRL